MDSQVLFYALVSVGIISLISLIGIFTISMKMKKLQKILIYLISFSAGAMFGDAFLHLLPETVAEVGFGLNISFSVLGGIVLGFIVEKVIHWHHCHVPHTHDHPHSFAWMNLVGDAVHNILDGLVILAAYLISIPVGIATTLAVAFHEIPQEIGDFGVLVHGGFSKKKALLFNFLISLTALIGVFIGFFLYDRIEGLEVLIAPFAAGMFIYIAGSDLIPELNKEKKLGKSLLQLLAFLLGIYLMFLLLEGHVHHEEEDHHDENPIEIHEEVEHNH